MHLDKHIIYNRAEDCLNVVREFYGNILYIPTTDEILFNFEFLESDCVAMWEYDQRVKYINHMISFNKKYFNNKSSNHNIEVLLSEVIPHELSHGICWLNAIEEHSDHGSSWKEFSMAMGGNGEVSHRVYE